MAFSVSAVYRTVDVQLSCTSTVLYTALRTPPASSLTAPETSPHGWAPTGCMRLNPQKTQLARFTTAGEDNNSGALQSQDWSPRLRPVASRNQSQTHSDATGLNGGERSWICNAPQARPAFSVLSAQNVHPEPSVRDLGVITDSRLTQWLTTLQPSANRLLLTASAAESCSVSNV